MHPGKMAIVTFVGCVLLRKIVNIILKRETLRGKRAEAGIGKILRRKEIELIDIEKITHGKFMIILRKNVLNNPKKTKRAWLYFTPNAVERLLFPRVVKIAAHRLIYRLIIRTIQSHSI